VGVPIEVVGVDVIAAKLGAVRVVEHAAPVVLADAPLPAEARGSAHESVPVVAELRDVLANANPVVQRPHQLARRALGIGDFGALGYDRDAVIVGNEQPLISAAVTIGIAVEPQEDGALVHTPVTVRVIEKHHTAPHGELFHSPDG